MKIKRLSNPNSANSILTAIQIQTKSNKLDAARLQFKMEKIRQMYEHLVKTHQIPK